MKRILCGLLCVLIATSGCATVQRRAADPNAASPEGAAGAGNGILAVPETQAAKRRDREQLLLEAAADELAVAETLSVPSQAHAAEGRAPSSAGSGRAEKKRRDPTVSVQKSQQIAAKRLTLPQLRAKYPEAFRVSGAPQDRRIALTFDDGPDDRFTPQVLDTLAAHGVRATFFVLGKKAEAHPEVLRRIVREGHELGNHSFSHPLFTKMTVEQFTGQIEQAETVIRQLGGYSPRLIRPPYGEIDEEQLQWAHKNGYTVVNWNVDSLDWKSIGAQEVSNNVLGHTKAGAIVLQHSAGGDTQDLSGTIQALPGIIARLREQHYELVPVSELLHLPKQK